MSSGAVNIGSLNGILAMRDEFTAQLNKFEAKLKQVEESTKRTTRTTKSETDKVNDSYRKVAASLDPVVANTHKFEKAELALNNALKAGVITQDQYNKTLAQAKEKYLSASAHTLTWREEIHSLSGKISNLSGLLGPFGSQIDNIVGNLTAIAGSTSAASKGVITFGAVTASVSAIVSKATTVVKGFIASISGPIIAAFSAVVVAAGLVYGAFVLISAGVNLVNDAVQNGLKTQLIIEKLNYALAANGSASGLSARQMVEYAESLELVTARSKEEIVAAETILSRFDSLGSEAFPKALDVTLAYAKAMGITADAAASKLGPAFEGSTRSLNALKDAGIVFTAGQRKTLTELVETGKVVEYQALLFNILKEKVGEAGNEYDNNLTRQVGRAKIVLEDFGEGIATEVIPALEDLVSSLVDAAGGWDKLKFVVSSGGREIGDIIRKTIYGIQINYHIWQRESDALAATVLGGLARIAEGFADFASFAGFIPGMEELAVVANEARGASERLGNAAVKAGMSAAQHEIKIIDLSAKLVEHRTALEGDAEAYDKLDSSIDDVIATNKEQKDVMDSVLLSIQEMQRKVLGLRAAYLAATISTKAYNAEILRQKVMDAILKEEHKLRAVNLTLTEKQRNAIASAVIEEEELNKKIKTTIDLNQKLLDIVLRVTDNIAKKGFAADFKRFTDDAHRGMELIQLDVESMLNGLSQIRDLDLEIKFSSRLLDVEPHLRGLEADYLSFLENLGSGFEQAGEDAIDAGERILTTIGTRFGKTADEIKAKLQLLSDTSLAAEYKDSLAPTNSLKVLRDTLDRLKTTTDKTGKSLLSAAEAQRIYTKALAQAIAETLDAASNLVSQIADITGSKSLSQAGNLLGAAGSAVGASNAYATDRTAMAAMGAIGAWLALFITAAEVFTKRGGIHYGAEVRSGGLGSLEITNDFTRVSNGLHEAQKAAKEVADTIENIVLSFGGQLQSITQFGIIQTGEGWAVSFGGAMRRYFTEFSDAVAWAAHQAISTADVSGISEEILEAFRNFTFRTLEDLQDFSNFAREYTSYGASELTGSLRTLSDWFVESSRKAYEYGLSIAKVSEEFGRRAQSWRDQVLGIVRSPEEQLRTNIVDFNRWIEQQKLAAQIQIDSAKTQMAAAQIQMNAAWANIKGQGLDADPEMQKLFLESQRLFKDAAARLDMWTKALENLPTIITPEEEEEAKKRLSKGGRGGGRSDSVRDFIEDRSFQLALRGMDEYARQQAEIIRQYEEQIEQTKRDSAERAKLIALKERELALLAQEQAKSTVASFREFLGLVTPFEQVKETAANIIKQIQASIFGDERKARMIGRILEDLDRQIEKMSKESAVSILGSMLQDLERFGASEALMNDARGHMAVVEHVLKMEHYRVEIAILKEQGKLSLEVMQILDKSFEFLAGIDLDDIFSGRYDNPSQDRASARAEAWYAAQAAQADAMKEAAAEVDRLREAFQKAKDNILDTVREFDLGKFGVVTPEKSLEEARNQFTAILQNARRGSLEAFEDAPEAFEDLLEAMERYSPALLATEGKSLRDQLESLGGLNTIVKDNLVITDFEKRQQHRELVGSLDNGFADLSQHASVQGETLQEVVTQLQTNNIVQAKILQRLEVLESNRPSVSGARVA